MEIPKDDGSKRPLAIACLEDKIVQSAVNKILTTIYEPIFNPNSFGGRPGKNAHQALRELSSRTYQSRDGAIVEIDIRKYFNSIPHEDLFDVLSEKITDERFLKLLKAIVETPTMVGMKAVPNLKGCPQGSIVSPILANIYLHYVVDIWFTEINASHIKGEANMVRYLDDMIFIFEHEREAKRFNSALPKRLNKFGLKIHEGKSRMIKSGTIQAKRAANQGKKLPTYQFLGFTCYWGKTKDGAFWRLKFSSRKDRFAEKLRGLRAYLMKHLNTPNCDALLKIVVATVKGWINYHGISDNKRRVHGFLNQAKHILLQWFNRRGGGKRTNWVKMNVILKRINYPERWKTISMFA